MKRYLVSLALIIVLSGSGSAHPAFGSVDAGIVYQSPANGDSHVPRRTTLIIRPSSEFIFSKTAKDFSFSVRGETSGVHDGTVRISDDKRTIIFKPDQPFELNEVVHVVFTISGQESFPPHEYSFRITPMSDQEQSGHLRRLLAEEKQEYLNFQKAVAQKSRHLTEQIPLVDTVPAYFPKLTIDLLDTANVASGNVFICPAGLSFLSILDNWGKPVFERQISPIGAQDFKVEIGNKLSYFELENISRSDILQGAVYVLNSHYSLIDSFRCGNGYLTDGHEFRLMADGHAWLEAYDAIDTDMRVVSGDPNANKRGVLFGCIIQEVDQNKDVVFQWRTWDHFNDTDGTHINYADPNHTDFDYAHLNSMQLDLDGNLIASFRNMDEVTKINTTNGKIMWRWGGKNNFFTFTGDTLQLSHQHDVRRLPNGYITLLDNGNYRKTIWADGTYHDTTYSRAVEYDLDENSLTANVVWEDLDIPYTFASGNVERLKNGNTFIGFGALNSPNALEVLPDGRKVYSLSLPEGSYNYRSFRFDWTPSLGVDASGQSTGSGPEVQIFPNPTSGSTNVSFASSGQGFFRINVVDILGNVVRTVSGQSEFGTRSLPLDLRSLVAGTYYCTLTQNGRSVAKVIVVQK